jgi:hypothetical protein
MTLILEAFYQLQRYWPLNKDYMMQQTSQLKRRSGWLLNKPQGRIWQMGQSGAGRMELQ